jgi:hypothetical protein
MTAKVAGRFSSPRQGTAACFAPMAMYPAHPYRRRVPGVAAPKPAVAHIRIEDSIINQMRSSDCARNESIDWVRQPAGLMFWWGLPIACGLSASFFSLPPAEAAFIWAAAFAWMGTGCLLNARRCGRLHCFISGPVFWFGAVTSTLVGTGVIGGGPTFAVVVWVTGVAAALSFVSELIWRKYA